MGVRHQPGRREGLPGTVATRGAGHQVGDPAEIESVILQAVMTVAEKERAAQGGQ